MERRNVLFLLTPKTQVACLKENMNVRQALEKMRAHGIEPKLLRMVQQRKGKEPKLFLLEGRRGGKKGFMKTLPTLFIEDEQGGFSQEMKTIYGSYKEQVTGE